uniref:ZF-HD dimerization-type domain-containing protein n=1 Tax=Kalanchoe fedtschenkoi TaxID=63787 RepID=A0A7N0V682_KALFE
MRGRRADQGRSNGAHQSFNNGSANNMPVFSTSIRYMECQRNQAVVVGGFAVDGCREFMATGQEGTAEALICAACTCHRSFHRRVEIHQAVNLTHSAATDSQQNGY